jgi:hypothetical protein
MKTLLMEIGLEDIWSKLVQDRLYLPVSVIIVISVRICNI